MGIEYNRQYIGARYVPTFFNNPNGSWEWAQGFQYEPLTIVRYGENTYTSKQLVPSNIGSPNENPEYWANTGNYNGAIIELNNKVNNNSNDIANLQAQIPPLITTNDKIMAYFDRYNLSNRNILIIGDSWTEGNSWAVRVKNYIELQKAGKITINAAGGHGFAAGDFLTLLQEAPAQKYTHIIVVGYATDQSQNILDVRKGAQEFRSAAQQLYPEAKLCYLMLSHKKYTSENINQLEYIMNIDGFQTVRADRILGDGTLYQEDNVHPNAEGQKRIANYLLNWFLGGDIIVYTGTLTTEHFITILTKELITIRPTSSIASILNNTFLSTLKLCESPNGLNTALINNQGGIVTINSNYELVNLFWNADSDLSKIKIGIAKGSAVEVNSVFNVNSIIFDRSYYGY